MIKALHYAIIFAGLVGLVFVLGRCTVQEAEVRNAQKQYEMESCFKNGGRWVYGYGSNWCTYGETK